MHAYVATFNLVEDTRLICYRVVIYHNDIIYHLIFLVMESLLHCIAFQLNLCMVSVAQRVRASSHAFVHNAVKLLLFLSPYINAQLTSGYYYNLLDSPITGELFKLNISTVDKCKHKSWLQSKRCDLYSVLL